MSWINTQKNKNKSIFQNRQQRQQNLETQLKFISNRQTKYNHQLEALELNWVFSTILFCVRLFKLTCNHQLKQNKKYTLVLPRNHFKESTWIWRDLNIYSWFIYFIFITQYKTKNLNLHVQSFHNINNIIVIVEYKTDTEVFLTQLSFFLGEEKEGVDGRVV